MIFRVAARIAAQRVCSLVWEGDTLVDWVAGGTRFQSDGNIIPRAVSYSYRFNAACGSPSGRYSVIYERLGTKGILLQEGRILREIDRSFYHADVYEFPVCIARLTSGQEVLIHCPDDYNRLEIDDLETGTRLTKCETRKPGDYFHSRLAVGPNSVYFLSAGWVWHPADSLCVYQVADAIQNPNSLDDFGIWSGQPTEISSAVFVDERHMVVATSNETFADDEDFAAGEILRPNSIAIWDIPGAKLLSQVNVAEPIGTLMAIDLHYAVGFYEHPKLIDLRTGQIVARLDAIESGKQASSIVHHIEPIPPLAFDPLRRRFAVATPTEILVVGIEPTE